MKAQPAVVLIFKRLRKRGHGLKSQPTDWEKPGIKPGPLAYKTYATGYVIFLFVVVFLGYNSQHWPGGFMFFVVLCTGDVMLVCGRVPWLYQYWPGGFMVLW